MWEIFARGYCALYGILILQLVSSVQHNENWKQIRWIPRIPSFRVIFGAEVIWINLNAKLGRLTVRIWQVEVFLTNSTEVCISQLVIFFLWKTIFDAFINCSCVWKMNPKMKILNFHLYSHTRKTFFFVIWKHFQLIWKCFSHDNILESKKLELILKLSLVLLNFPEKSSVYEYEINPIQFVQGPIHKKEVVVI